MAGSMYAYVRNFELPDPVLPNTYMVIRIDGKGFHKFSDLHRFEKPNDARALELMNCAARHVMNDMRPDVVLAFGESDEYSFLLRKPCTLYKRRASKLVTHITSLFTSAYVFYWSHYMPADRPLQRPPSFDGRLIVYPSEKEVRDYFAWRQADTHINNLYNTTFWALIQNGGQTERQAHETLQGTVSGDKNEILFTRYGINYDKLPAMFRKGSTLVWSDASAPATTTASTEAPSTLRKAKPTLRTLHVDIIGKSFWTEAEKLIDRREKQDSTPADQPAEAWQDPDWIHNYVGLGKLALSS